VQALVFRLIGHGDGAAVYRGANLTGHGNPAFSMAPVVAQQSRWPAIVVSNCRMRAWNMSAALPLHVSRRLDALTRARSSSAPVVAVAAVCMVCAHSATMPVQMQD